eukprot:TRINITY_DN3851_c0_g1_i5.p1 TRINITY_DN3851_c0_g1~~TRINITY_DN3851_c0_g1_i5.p1  ORF type:complete len:283 (+),score=22.18 TRINITY_DN3851_c0_g1_i5:137-985(+)
MKCGCFSYYLLLLFVLWIDAIVFANIQGYSLLTEENQQISVNRCRTPTCEVIEYLGDKELSKNVPTFYTPISGLQVDPYNQNTAACTGLLCGANAACDPSSGDIAMNNFAACSGACCAANSGCITVNPYTQCQGANFRIEQCLGLPYGSTSSGGYGFGSSAGGWGQGRNGGGFGVQGGGCGCNRCTCHCGGQFGYKKCELGPLCHSSGRKLLQKEYYERVNCQLAPELVDLSPCCEEYEVSIEDSKKDVCDLAAKFELDCDTLSIYNGNITQLLPGMILQVC